MVVSIDRWCTICAMCVLFTVMCTVPLIVDSPKTGHSTINLSTKDMTYCPSIIPTIHFEPLKEENPSTKNKSAKFMSSPKCPLFEGSTVY